MSDQRNARVSLECKLAIQFERQGITDMDAVKREADRIEFGPKLMTPEEAIVFQQRMFREYGNGRVLLQSAAMANAYPRG